LLFSPKVSVKTFPAVSFACGKLPQCPKQTSEGEVHPHHFKAPEAEVLPEVEFGSRYIGSGSPLEIGTHNEVAPLYGVAPNPQPVPLPYGIRERDSPVHMDYGEWDAESGESCII